MTAPGNRNRGVHRAVTDLTALFLAGEGIDSTVKTTYARISDSLGDDALDPNIALDGIDLRVSSKLVHRLSEDLATVTRGAEIRGVPIAAVVQWRDKAIENSYAIVSLADFAKLVRGDHLTP